MNPAPSRWPLVVIPVLIVAAVVFIYMQDEASSRRYVAQQVTDPRRVESFNAYKALAERGDVEAQYHLGFCYELGLGVTKDDLQAATWYRKAAERGHPAAQCFLGVAYAKGQGVPKDLVQATFWYRRAAEQGFETGLALLAGCFLKGEGVPKDLVQAYAYFNLPASNSRQKADELEKKMTVDQVASGQKLSRELQLEIDSRKAVK